MHPPTSAAETKTGLPSRSHHTPAVALERHTEPLPPSEAAYTNASHGAKAAKKRGMQKLIMSAFKRLDHESGASGSSASSHGGANHVVDAAGAQDFSWSSSSSAGGSSGRKGRRASGDDGSTDGDRSSHDSLDMEGSNNLKAIAALRNAKIGSSYEAFPWERKMTDLLPVPNASRFLSLLLLPRATDESQTRYHSLEDTLARADAWLTGSNNLKAIAALRNAKIGSSYEAFPWERKMTDLLPVPNASRFLSLLLLPRATDESQTRYHSLEDTLARADAWLRSSQRSGVPIGLMNVQAEALLTKISGDTALSTVNMGSLGDLVDLATMSLYGFEDYHGVDIGVVRAARLWYAPVAGELALEIKLQPGDTRLGFAISRTEEGFIYVSSVADDSTPGVASTRSGLLELYRRSRRASKLLVVARVGREKVLPWAVCTAGDVRCADTVSLSQRLTLHRQALRPVTLSFLVWDRELTAAGLLECAMATKPQAPASVQDIVLPTQMTTNDEVSSEEITIDEDCQDIVLSKDYNDCALRFQNIGLPDSWL